MYRKSGKKNEKKVNFIAIEWFEGAPKKYIIVFALKKVNIEKNKTAEVNYNHC